MQASLVGWLRSRGRSETSAGGVEAIDEALAYRPSAEEQAAIAPIESERARLESSDRIVRTMRTDYEPDASAEDVFEENQLGDFCRRASRPPDAAGLLFALVRLLRPSRALELGTALGISAAYQGAALRLNGSGRLITVEISTGRAAVAREVLDRLSLAGVVDSRHGAFNDVAPDALRDGVGYAFVDGHHEEQATLDYLEMIEPHLVPPGVVVFDDITWSEGMARAWATLRSDARVVGYREAFGMGICVYR
jgi:predicted O-methyltransferase YrrM